MHSGAFHNPSLNVCTNPTQASCKAVFLKGEINWHEEKTNKKHKLFILLKKLFNLTSLM